MRVVGCFIEHKNKFLILHRNPGKSQENAWGLPAGKVDAGETDREAIIRESFEETGIRIKTDQLKPITEFFWEFPDKVVEFPTFKVILDSTAEVKLRPDEHQDYKWVTPEECSKMNLVHGFDDVLKKLYGIEKTQQ